MIAKFFHEVDLIFYFISKFHGDHLNIALINICALFSFA